VQVANQLVKSEIRLRQSGKIIGLTKKEFWSITRKTYLLFLNSPHSASKDEHELELIWLRLIKGLSDHNTEYLLPLTEPICTFSFFFFFVNHSEVTERKSEKKLNNPFSFTVQK
jgi:hypothetical protein